MVYLLNSAISKDSQTFFVSWGSAFHFVLFAFFKDPLADCSVLSQTAFFIFVCFGLLYLFEFGIERMKTIFKSNALHWVIPRVWVRRGSRKWCKWLPISIRRTWYTLWRLRLLRLYFTGLGIPSLELSTRYLMEFDRLSFTALICFAWHQSSQTMSSFNILYLKKYFLPGSLRLIKMNVAKCDNLLFVKAHSF